MPRRKRGQLIDAADARIISQLAQDGRMPNVAIAKTVGLSETAVRRRLERLLNNKVVWVACQTNPQAMGYTVDVIFQLMVDSSQAEEIGHRLALEGNVRYAAVSLGEYDLILWASFKSNEAMMDFIANRVRTIPGVHRCQTYPIFRLLKQANEWNPLAGEQAQPTVQARRRRPSPRKPETAPSPKSETSAQPQATPKLSAPAPRRKLRASRAR